MTFLHFCCFVVTPKILEAVPSDTTAHIIFCLLNLQFIILETSICLSFLSTYKFYKYDKYESFMLNELSLLRMIMN